MKTSLPIKIRLGVIRGGEYWELAMHDHYRWRALLSVAHYEDGTWRPVDEFAPGEAVVHSERGEAYLNLHKSGWRLGWTFLSPLAGSLCPKTPFSHAYPSREAAFEAGIDKAIEFFKEMRLPAAFRDQLYAHVEPQQLTFTL